uniref:RING-type domain-containing protein n=1 Tax=Labrus bergylta TaxID=56723 RepID=A0A3Q3H441_9LABR
MFHVIDWFFSPFLEMSAASCMLSEEQFLCSICLDVFTDPVSIPCGHNFCKSCITHHWDVNDQCECPMCKDVFEKRPQLRVNTFISEMAAQFRQSTVKRSSRMPWCGHLMESHHQFAH